MECHAGPAINTFLQFIVGLFAYAAWRDPSVKVIPIPGYRPISSSGQ
jgi:hypothetical protein